MINNRRNKGTDVVTIKAIERATNSTSGNPRWFLRTDFGTFHTAPDCDFNYSLDNHRFPQRDVLLVLNGWGKVTEIFLSDGSRA